MVKVIDFVMVCQYRPILGVRLFTILSCQYREPPSRARSISGLYFTWCSLYPPFAVSSNSNTNDAGPVLLCHSSNLHFHFNHPMRALFFQDRYNLVVCPKYITSTFLQGISVLPQCFLSSDHLTLECKHFAL